MQGCGDACRLFACGREDAAEQAAPGCAQRQWTGESQSTSRPNSCTCVCVTKVQCVRQVTGLLLGLVRDKCAALTTDLVAKANGLSDRPVDLQPYMQLQVCSVMLKLAECDIVQYSGSAG